MARTKKRTARRAAKKTRRAASTIKPQAVTPYIYVTNGAAAVDWYKTVFGAKEFNRQEVGGKIMHTGLDIGDSHVYLSDIMPGSDMQDPSRVGTSVDLHDYRPNAGHVWERAVANGAKVTMPFEDQFWGDIYGKVRDPFGHSWSISRKSQLSKKELEKMREKAMGQFGA